MMKLVDCYLWAAAMSAITMHHPIAAFAPSFGIRVSGDVSTTITHSHQDASASSTTSTTSSTSLYSMSMDDAPSDYDSEDLTSPEKSVEVDTNEEDADIRDDLKRELLLLSSVTNRGEFASPEEKDIFVDLITQLEALNPTLDPARNCVGEWDLCCTNTQAFRSSPFFMAIRSAMGDNNKNIALNGFDIHERATSASRIGRVRQTITKDSLVSEVDLEVGVMPGLPILVKGTVITTASLVVVAPETWEVSVEGTQVKGSNIPFLDQYLDDNPIEVPVGQAYSTVMGNIPTSTLKTYYVDEGIRISRDEDDNYFVFVRA
jgi:hypothetical protein